MNAVIRERSMRCALGVHSRSPSRITAVRR
jgi:hypothetical protein